MNISANIQLTESVGVLIQSLCSRLSREDRPLFFAGVAPIKVGCESSGGDLDGIDGLRRLVKVVRVSAGMIERYGFGPGGSLWSSPQTGVSAK